MRFPAALPILLLATTSMAVYGQSGKRQSGPSLIETEHWIENTFNNDNVGYFQNFSVDNTLDQSYSITFEGCTLGFEASEVQRYTSDGTHHERQSSVVYFANLKDIDPSTIKVYFYDVIKVRRAFVGLMTTNNENKITTFMFPNDIKHLVSPSVFRHEKHSTSELVFRGDSIPSDKSGIVMAPDYAPRFINAMRHAVQLCGGKRSIF